MNVLTKAEEKIMQVLWDHPKSFVKDIIEELPKPKPAYNTVATIMGILEKKGFVSHKQYGKSFAYYAVVDKETYSTQMLSSYVNNYFNGSFKQMVSFFVEKENIDLQELDEILTVIKRSNKK